MQISFADLSVLDAEFDGLKESVAANDVAAATRHPETLAQLSLGVAECLSPSPLPKPMTAAEFDAGVMGATTLAPDPAIDEAANTLLALIGNSVATFCSAMTFKTWCQSADLSGSVGEIRERFFEAHPGHYLTKTVCRHLLATQGIAKE
jgi:hypothetical protein